MPEFHFHFTQKAGDPGASPYSHRETLTDAQCNEWRAHLTTQMELAFAALKTMPVDATRAISVSMTVKQ